MILSNSALKRATGRAVPIPVLEPALAAAGATRLAAGPAFGPEAGASPAAPGEAAHLRQIMAARQLHAVLQPIIDHRSGAIAGYEGLIRGPADSKLGAPSALFAAARAQGLTLELERLCRQVVLARFAALDLPGKLFLNVSPACLLPPASVLDFIADGSIDPARLVIELTEHQPTADYARMKAALAPYRQAGMQIALDDLGEGYSSLRLWSELQPDYVKIDMHFIQGINHDPIKLQFVRAIQQIAEHANTLVIAEGIETQAELLVLRDLGIAYGQGYHLGRPEATPARAASAAVVKALGHNGVAVYPHAHGDRDDSIARLLHRVRTVAPSASNNEVYALFLADPKLLIIPVVADGVPCGLISRFEMIAHFARPYERELYGKKACSLFMDGAPLIVARDTSLEQLSFRMAQADAHHLSNGFIITDQGRYLGMGTGHDLMREITRMQITAARYANPLTQLPGNVPINEHVDRLLQSGTRFWACYCDLDQFKPFNDVYGYRKGDDVIQLTGQLLGELCNPDRDFIGHIGGDDFMVLFQSEDWEARCAAILARFRSDSLACYSADDQANGGYLSEDRQGNKVFFPLITLSLGVVKVEPHQYYSHHQIATAAAEAKKQAKKMQGNSVFLDRRQ